MTNVEWIIAGCSIIGGLGTLFTMWLFRDRLLSPLYRMLRKWCAKLTQRRGLTTVTIRKGDTVKVKLIDYKFLADLGPLGSWQDPYVQLLEWHSGRASMPVSVGFKAIPADSEDLVFRHLGYESGEGMLIPNRENENLRDECWSKKFVKNSPAWATLKKLVVFEVFTERYRNIPLEAKVVAVGKGAFLVLTNKQYDQVLEREYDACVLLMNLFQNEGLEWLERLQKMPQSAILGYIKQNYNQLRAWVLRTEGAIDAKSVTEARLQRVMISLIAPRAPARLLRWWNSLSSNL
ncbi:MAG: hypothetical protein KAW13_01340 [Dehalococcoidia bacterium]|nr:hypothetical protein [Dehalococcoidia bacterium]